MVHRYQKQIDAVQNNDLFTFKSFFNNEKFNPSFLKDWAIRYSAEVGNIDIVKLLIKDERVNINSCNNTPIINALKSGHTEIVHLLWNDKRVKSSLKKDNIKLYNKLIKQQIKNTVEQF